VGIQICSERRACSFGGQELDEDYLEDAMLIVDELVSK